MIGLVKRALGDIVDVVIPDCCIVCGRKLVEGERHVCLHCLATLPRTNSHQLGGDLLGHRLASPDVVIEQVVSWFFYTSGAPETALITAAKYNDRRTLAIMNGRLYAGELLSSGFFKGIDCMQPVPLSRWKKWKRGYNQSELIARGINEVTGIPIVNYLKARQHATQTRKNAYQRWMNTLSVYSTTTDHTKVTPPRHILLVDDVLTTGSTILACAIAIHRAFPDALISVLTLGVARKD